MRLRLRDREPVAFGVDGGRERDALTRSGFGSFADLAASGHDRCARRLDVVDVEPEPGVTLRCVGATMQGDRRPVLHELGPFRRLVPGLEAEHLLIEGRAARDVGGHEHEVRLRDLHRSPPAISGSACRSVVSSATLPVAASGRIRLTSPVRTFPGPNSTKADAPSPAARRTEATHCTGDHTCFSRSGGISRACWCTLASTLATIGYRSALKVVTAIACRSRGATARIAGEWNAAETRSGTTRFAPASFRTSLARARSELSPEITTCPGALSFATTTAVPTSARATTYASSPRTAAIAPEESEACIKSPRVRTRRSASARASTPAATSAVNSPSE